MINQEEKKDLVINLIVLTMKIVKNLKILLNLRNKNITEEEEIELFKKIYFTK